MTQQVYIRHPDLGSDFFVFVSDDDLWRVDFKAGPDDISEALTAYRLTTNSAQVSHPKISKDGESIAYESTESGEKEIYVIGSKGGLTHRVTYKGTASLYGWTDEGNLLITSQYGRYGSLGLYTISPSGEQINCQEFGMVSAYAQTPYGDMVARNPADIAYWKDYRGGKIGEIWTKPTGADGFSRILSDSRAHLCHVVCVGEWITFISDRDGCGEIYATDFLGSQVHQITSSRTSYVRSFSIMDSRLLYMSAGRLWLQTFAGTQKTSPARELSIIVPSSFEQARPRFIQAKHYLQSFAPSYSASVIMTVIRGTVYVMNPWIGPAQRIHLGAEFVRARQVYGFGQKPAPAKNSSKKISTQPHEQGRDFLVVAVNTLGEDRLIHLVWDPQHRQYHPKVLYDQSLGKIWRVKGANNQEFVLISTLRYELWHLCIKTSKCHLITRCDRAVDHMNISPDHQWVAYSAENKILYETYLYHVEKHTQQKLFPSVKSDTDQVPTFDCQENLLYLFSDRDIKLTESGYPYFLTSLYESRPYVLTGNKVTASLLDRSMILFDSSGSDSVQKDENQNQDKHNDKDQEHHKDQTQSTSPSQDHNHDSPQDPQITFDFRDIESRLEALPLEHRRWSQIYSTANKIFFLEESPQSDDEDSYELHSYTKSTGEVSRTGDRLNHLILSGDGKSFLARAQGQLILCGVDEKITSDDNSKSKPKIINLSRVRHQIDPKQEWDQMLVEALYLQKENLLNDASRPNYDEILNRHRALIPHVHTRSEFSDLIWDMQGDLKTSHCYEYRGDYHKKPTYQPCGYLGAQLSYHQKKKCFVISYIQRGEPWNAKSRSPLLGPGVALSEGDEIHTIDGQRFQSIVDLDQYLDHRASTDVALYVKRTKSGSFHHSYKKPTQKSSHVFSHCRIKTLARHSELSYHDWVQRNREYVSQQSKGKVGYLHIPDMSEFGLTEFYKHYLKEIDHSQLIVDIRYNRGGSVSEIIINHLASKAIASQHGKWMSHIQPYPLYSAPQQIVCLINGYAGSDGDIFSQAFKDLGLGTLVGTRTWGGVIGIWPRISLVDGTTTSQPEYSFVFHKDKHVLENEGVVPDVTVEITPDDWQNKIDPQLDQALKIFHSS